MDIGAYGQMLSSLAGYESFLLALWGFFYTGHAALVVAVYNRQRRLSFIEAGVLLLVYAFAWKVNFSGVQDTYQHLQKVYAAMGTMKAPSAELTDYYRKQVFWGPGAGGFDRALVVPTIFRIAGILTVLFVMGCHAVQYEEWWQRDTFRRWVWTNLLPRKKKKKAGKSAKPAKAGPGGLQAYEG